MSSRIGLKYIRGDSLLHRMEPLSKLIYVFCSMIMMLITLNLILQTILLIMVLVVTFLLGRIPISKFLRPFVFLAPLILSVLILSPIMVGLRPGMTPLFDASPIPFSREGLLFGILLVQRFLIMALSSLTVLWTTHPRDLTRALSESFIFKRLKVPYTVAHALEIGIVYLPVVDYEATTIQYGLKVRGVAKTENYLSKTFKRAKKLMVSMVIRGLSHAQLTAVAMETRAFGAYDKRVYLRPKFRSTWYSKVFQYSWMTLTVLWIILNWGVIGKIAFEV